MQMLDNHTRLPQGPKLSTTFVLQLLGEPQKQMQHNLYNDNYLKANTSTTANDTSATSTTKLLHGVLLWPRTAIGSATVAG